MIRIHRMACGFTCELCGAQVMRYADVVINDAQPVVSPYADLNTQADAEQTNEIRSERDRLAVCLATFCGPIRIIGLHLA